jgi:hypothetical protein
MPSQPPKLLDQARAALRARHYPAHAEEAVVLPANALPPPAGPRTAADPIPALLDQAREALRVKHYAIRTVQ